jgi:hypothetical protein
LPIIGRDSETVEGVKMGHIGYIIDPLNLKEIKTDIVNQNSYPNMRTSIRQKKRLIKEIMLLKQFVNNYGSIFNY